MAWTLTATEPPARSSSVHPKKQPDIADPAFLTRRADKRIAADAERRNRDKVFTVEANGRAREHDFGLTPLETQERDWHHSGSMHRRLKMRDAMLTAHLPAARLERFDACGNSAVVEQDEVTGRFRVRANYCKDRCCPRCGSARAALVARQLATIVGDRVCRMITLTLLHRQVPLATQIDRLRTCYAQLRRREAWRDHVTGAAACLEIQRNEKTKGWHVHFHVLVVGKFFPHSTLKREWLAVTGDSTIVHITRIDPSEKQRLSYVAKYVGKPVPAEIINDHDALVEVIRSLHGRRLLSTSGEFHNASEAGEEAQGDWKFIGRLTDIIDSASRGNIHHQTVLKRIKRGHTFATLLGPDPPSKRIAG